MWLSYLSSRTVFLFFCTLRLASTPTMFPSTKSTSYRRMMRNTRSSTAGISFMWTPWNCMGLSPSILVMNKMNNFEVSSSSLWVPCKWRASARKRHKLSFFGCLVFSSNVRQLIVQFFKSGSGKSPSLHPIGTSLSKTANTVKVVNLQKLHCVFILSRLQDSMTSVLSKISLKFAKSSWVQTSLDRSSSVMSSCA